MIQWMSKGCFVTGTDTGVGKTVVSALLTLLLDGLYWKPIQSGTEPSTDRADVLRWTGLGEERALPERYRLQLPASPHLSAAREGLRIALEDFLLPARERRLIVEGAGGVLVPLNESATMRDLMLRLALPVVVVARSSLGTINHTCLTLEALRSRGIQVAGVIVNGPRDRNNEDAIRRYGQVDILASVEPLPELTPQALRAAAHTLGQNREP